MIRQEHAAAAQRSRSAAGGPSGAHPDLVVIVQPPFVQLNGPYPSPYYLGAYLSGTGRRTRILDHSIGLFERVFSGPGAERIFRAAHPIAEALMAAGAATASTAEADSAAPRRRPGPPDRLATEAELEQLGRYLSEESRWIGTMDRLTAFLRGEDREFAYLLAAANGALPTGSRYDRALEALGGDPSVDDAPLLATALLSDMADFVRYVLDPSFDLVRYAESLSASVGRFSDAEPGADGWILRTFYEELLEEEWKRLDAELLDGPPGGGFHLALTVPFPGCLAGALAAARSAKRRFGDRVRVLAGGGYVNTELRRISAPAFFDYVDFLCFDRGYGALEAVLEDGDDARSAGRSLYKTIYRDDQGRLVGTPETLVPAYTAGRETSRREDGAADPPRPGEGNAVPAALAALDRRASASVFPDYGDVNFRRYLRPVDDENPMHRLWSDGRWLKAYLAHGCYWRNCAFCDVQLDYVKGYDRVDADALFDHLVAQAATTGVRGVHLCDEAAPPASLFRLAERNRVAGLPLLFWGNLRFERSFDADAARLLGAGAFVGASAGIEVASDSGFARVGKGIGLADVVTACAAFKEAGILVHAYLIYGYWDEDEAELVDSVELLRQLFAAGLVDSAFWHKFVLTRHSRIFAEWRSGAHPGLAPLDPDGDATDFADNDLRFAGEDRLSRFGPGLDAAVAAWMAGEELDGDPRRFFPFKAAAPRVAPDTVERLIDAYARSRDEERARPPDPEGRDEYRFLGGDPVVVPERGNPAGGATLTWRDRGQASSLRLGGDDAAAALAGELRAAAREGSDGRDIAATLGRGRAAEERWFRLRSAGLVRVRGGRKGSP